jgi:peptide deformylase
MQLASKNKIPPFVFNELSREHTIDPFIQKFYSLRVWGLAAPEIGLDERLFVMDFSEERNQLQCFVNPIIASKEGSILTEEDSFHLPNASINVLRAKKITLHYQDETGMDSSIILEDLPAILAQQKIEYLDGISLLDHLSKLKRERLLKKMKKESHSQACGHGCGHDHSK